MSQAADVFMGIFGLKRVKTKKCRVCKTEFYPAKPLQIVCGTKCAITHANIRKAKKEAQEKKLERQQDKIKRESLKRRSDYVKEAQKAINALRRTEELMNGSGCISCGRSQEEVIAAEGWKPGGAFDAGHFLSVGAYPEKRFNPNNIWLQCKSCNAGSGKFSHKARTVSEQYEKNLIKLKGQAFVDELKKPEPMPKLSIDDLKEITATCKAKLKELKCKT